MTISSNKAAAMQQHRLGAALNVWVVPIRKDKLMIIGDRLRELRQQRNLSQEEIENRTGLLRCYISRVENGHTVPAFETIEKFARALEVPLYQLFYDGEAPPALPNIIKRKSAKDVAWGRSGKEARLLEKFRQLLSRTDEDDRKLLFFMAQKMARGKAAPSVNRN
jgi:transcriptional regulator with XRE-family HTH domain